MNQVDAKKSKLKRFVSGSLEKWEKIKKDFSANGGIAAFLLNAKTVVMFDHHQIDGRFAETLYRKIKYPNGKEPTSEELKQEEFRQKMVSYFESECREIFFEIRFQELKLGLIQELKMHLAIKDLNLQSPASIRVVIDSCKL